MVWVNGTFVLPKWDFQEGLKLVMCGPNSRERALGTRLP